MRKYFIFTQYAHYIMTICSLEGSILPVTNVVRQCKHRIHMLSLFLLEAFDLVLRCGRNMTHDCPFRALVQALCIRRSSW